jgi:hypothetical protein
VQIDGNQPWRMTANYNPQALGQLQVGLGTHPADFVTQVEFGSVLKITTNNGTRVFPLAGSTAAIKMGLSCIDSIVQEHQQSVPALAPPVRPVQPLAPATPTYRTL